MVLWLICGLAFGHYLAEFAYTYVNYYVGLGPVRTQLAILASGGVARGHG